MSDDERPDARPVLRVVRGNPTAEELAALVTVLAARSGGGAPPASRPASGWADPGRLMRRHSASTRGGWRSSALPG